MKMGAWVHGGDNLPLDPQIRTAAGMGMNAVRTYDIGNSEEIVPVLKDTGMTLLAGMNVDGEALLEDWRSQVRLEELERYHQLGVPLDAICVGNELRQYGDAFSRKMFTARLSFALARVLEVYRERLDKLGLDTPLTYAMEAIVLDGEGNFHEWMWPLIDVCQVVSINLYPMDAAAWTGLGAFEESRLLLEDAGERHLRFDVFDLQLRKVLKSLAPFRKPLILSETGFPSAIDCRREGNQYVPVSGNEAYAVAMPEFISLIRKADQDYDGLIQSLYFYEWRDNLHHGAIWNEEAPSPIHTSFGLCDRAGKPKLDIKALIA